MTPARPGLIAQRHIDWRAHFRRNRLCHILTARLINRQQFFQIADAGLRGCHRPCRKSSFGSSDRRLSVFLTAKRNGGKRNFSCWINHRKICAIDWRDPTTVDIKFGLIQHHPSPYAVNLQKATDFFSEQACPLLFAPTAVRRRLTSTWPK